MSSPSHTLVAAAADVAWLWQDAKVFLRHSIDFSQDAVHVIVSVVIFLGAAMVLRRPVSSLVPWLVVLVLSCVNEISDLWTQTWPHPERQYAESLKDVVLTMLLPSVLVVAFRYLPGLVGPAQPPGPDAA